VDAGRKEKKKKRARCYLKSDFVRASKTRLGREGGKGRELKIFPPTKGKRLRLLQFIGKRGGKGERGKDLDRQLRLMGSQGWMARTYWNGLGGEKEGGPLFNCRDIVNRWVKREKKKKKRNEYVHE